MGWAAEREIVSVWGRLTGTLEGRHALGTVHETAELILKRRRADGRPLVPLPALHPHTEAQTNPVLERGYQGAWPMLSYPLGGALFPIGRARSASALAAARPSATIKRLRYRFLRLIPCITRVLPIRKPHTVFAWPSIGCAAPSPTEIARSLSKN
jgi:hypothetical protein